MKQRVLFKCTLEAPMTISREREPRTPGTLDHIPGTVLRGAVISALMRQGKELNELLFLCDRRHARFPFLFPNGSIVAPFSLRECKRIEDHPTRDLLPELGRAVESGFEEVSLESLSDRYTCGAPECGEDTRPVRGFVDRNGIPDRNCPPITTRMHVGIDRTTGTAFDGILFGHMQVEPAYIDGSGNERKATFMGTGYLDSDAMALVGSLQGSESLLIGKNRSRGQGSVSFELLDDTDVQTVAPVYRSNDQDTLFSIDIHTPLIGFDPFLRPSSDPRDWLPSKIADSIQDTLVTLCRQMTVSGYDMAANLPKEDDIAVAPGSVLLCRSDMKRESLFNELTELQKTGLGERKNEGYGEVSFNLALHEGGA